MRRSASLPNSFHALDGTGRARRDSAASAASRAEALLSDSVLIRATPGATKVMRVQFVAMRGELLIRFTQVTDGRVQAFELCRLDCRTLVAGWFWDDPAMFILAATDHGKLFCEIYCYPTDVPRDVWLGVLESNHVVMMPFYQRLNRSVDTADAHDTAHTFGHLINTVCEVTDFGS